MPAPPRLLNPRLPAAFERIIMTCLEKDRERRYRSAAALLADLDAVARELPAGEGRKPGRRIKPFNFIDKGHKFLYFWLGLESRLFKRNRRRGQDER